MDPEQALDYLDHLAARSELTRPEHMRASRAIAVLAAVVKQLKAAPAEPVKPAPAAPAEPIALAPAEAVPTGD